MALFKYKAVDQAGRTVEDVMDASCRAELITKLSNLSLMPFDVAEESSGQISAFSIGKYFGARRVSGRDITQFTVQFSALVNAKMNLSKALRALEQSSDSNGIGLIVRALLEDVNKGKNLSDALEAFPEYFPPLYVSMIRVGEAGGIMDKALQRIVEMRQKDEELIGKIRGALAYPCVMAVVMLGSLIVMMAFVIPKFGVVFTQMGATLPLTTRAVLFSSSFLASWWWLFLITAAVSVSAVCFLLRREDYRIRFDKLKLSIPVLGVIIKWICIARYSFSMGALLSSGVSMMKALEATSAVTGNFFIESALKQIAAEVRSGSSLSTALRKRNDIFPPLMTGMVGTGEESGNLDEMLCNAGEYFRRESERRINTLTTLFEPVMIVVMGGVVGFIVSAILLPIFNISTSIH